MIILQLINARFPEKQPTIPESLKRRISIFYTCELTDTECDMFSRVLVGLERMLEQDTTIKPELWAHVVFAGLPLLAFQMDDVAGSFAPLVIYPVYAWRAKKLDAYGMIAAMVEELCHCFWSIRDENLVKDKDREFFKKIDLPQLPS